MAMPGGRGGRISGNDTRRLLTAAVPDGQRFVPIINDQRQVVIPLETLMNIRRRLENQEHPNTVLETSNRIKKKHGGMRFYGGSMGEKPLSRSDLHRRLNSVNNLLAQTFHAGDAAVDWPNHGLPSQVPGG